MMDLGATTHTGYVRAGNEDGFFVSEAWPVFAVADGMGGHAHGEVASALAMEAIATFAQPLATIDPGELATQLHDAVQAANAAIFSQASSQDARNRMGTTLVLATIRGDRLYFAHIGDSRLYLLRGEVFTQLTRDHSRVQAMVDNGEISPEEAAIHPLRHQITRVVGGDDRVSPDIASQALEPGDAILLCTDGLSGSVTNERIKAILATELGAQQTAEALVDAALAAGGPDNITAVVVNYQRPRELPVATSALKGAHHRAAYRRSMLYSILALLLVLGAIFTWGYTHPRYMIGVDTRNMLTLYKSWPALPMLHKQRVPAPGVLPITYTDAQPYLKYHPLNGDMRNGFQVDGRDVGISTLNDITTATAAGLLDNARKALQQQQLPQAISLLARAQALNADPAMVKKLAAQIAAAQQPAIVPIPPHH